MAAHDLARTRQFEALGRASIGFQISHNILLIHSSGCAGPGDRNAA
jgi:hypothetical protein